MALFTFSLICTIMFQGIKVDELEEQTVKRGDKLYLFVSRFWSLMNCFAKKPFNPFSWTVWGYIVTPYED